LIFRGAHFYIPFSESTKLKSEFQIADRKIQPQLNCVMRGKDLVRLEPKIMQVLVELVSRHGEVLTKEELIHAVWPDTYVGDDALVRCISELRRVFEDDPRSPHVIQTISKIGYRLIAPVQFTADIVEQSVPPTATSAPASHSNRALTVSAAAVLLILILVIGGLALLAKVANRHDKNVSFRTIPFTTYSGSERQPSFSPDGNQLAFIWNGEKGGESWNVYVKMAESETPLRLTSKQAEDLSPEWSPDGKWIAFIRHSPEGDGVYLVPSIGGPERRIHELHCAIDWDDPGLSWSPDGKYLVFPDGKSQLNPSSIVLLAMDTLQPKELTMPPHTWDGDFGPVFSPDGKRIAFIRGADGAARNIYVMDANGDNQTQLTTSSRLIFGISWTGDGKYIVFSSDLGGTASLWRVTVSGGTPARLPFGTDNAFTPTVSRSGSRLAYSQGSSTWSLMRLDLKSSKLPGTKLVSSTEQDSAPQFSHDGRRVAFQSWRSGTQEIWISNSDGTGPQRMTSFDGPITGSPSWSPDDRRIAFDSRQNDRSHIFVMNSAGGTPTALTSGDYNDIIPSWSKDGKWIYFGSKRNDSWQIWKVSVDNGESKQVTTDGGFVAHESYDGRWLYFTKYGISGLWRVPAGGGNEEKVLEDPPANYWGYFSLSKDGLYFLGTDHSQTALRFQNFSNFTATTLYIFPKSPARFSGLSISPDGRWVLYTDQSSQGNNIMLVQDFQ
jgi:Tol biopolymer transport system component/DNA-binding winged helix-turn-helix (wHTH) protein